MKLFLDANILVSVLNKEYPVFSYSARILSLADDTRFELITSPICLAIAFYFSEKKSGSKFAKAKMEMLCSKLTIAAVGELEVTKAITDKKVNDFEDGLEYYSALRSKCKYIITEDIADYYFSEIGVLNSQAFIERLINGKI